MTDRPSFIALRTIIAWPAPNAQNTEHAPRLRARRRRGRGHQGVLGLRPGEDLRGRRRGPRAHPRRWSTAAAQAKAEWEKRSTPGAPPTRSAPRCSTGSPRGELPDGWDGRAPGLPAGQGRRHPRRLRQGAQRARRRSCPSCGAARPTSPARTTRPSKGEPSFLPAERLHARVRRRPVRPHAALRHPRARDGRDPVRHRACTATDPAYGGTFLVVQRLHARRRPARRR